MDGGDGWVGAAEAAGGVLGEVQGAEGSTKCIVDDDFPEGRVADVED